MLLKRQVDAGEYRSCLKAISELTDADLIASLHSEDGAFTFGYCLWQEALSNRLRAFIRSAPDFDKMRVLNKLAYASQQELGDFVWSANQDATLKFVMDENILFNILQKGIAYRTPAEIKYFYPGLDPVVALLANDRKGAADFAAMNWENYRRPRPLLLFAVLLGWQQRFEEALPIVHRVLEINQCHGEALGLKLGCLLKLGRAPALLDDPVVFSCATKDLLFGVSYRRSLAAHGKRLAQAQNWRLHVRARAKLCRIVDATTARLGQAAHNSA